MFIDTHIAHILRLPLSPTSSFFFLSDPMKQSTHPSLDLEKMSYCRVCSLAFCPTSEGQDDIIWNVSFLCHTLTIAKERSERTGADRRPPAPSSPWNTARCIFSLHTFHISSLLGEHTWGRASCAFLHLILKQLPGRWGYSTILLHRFPSVLTLIALALHLPTL